MGVCAGLGIALAPLSATAADTFTDTLRVNVNDSITFGLDTNGDGDYDDTGESYPVTHTDGTNTSASANDAGHWGGNALDPANSHNRADTLTGTILQGHKNDNFGSTEIKIFSSKQYHILAQANTVSGANLDSAEYSTSVTGWMYNPSVTGNLAINSTNATTGQMNVASTTEFELASSSTASVAAGDTLTVVYGVGVASNATAGTYTGSMTYTAAQTQ